MKKIFILIFFISLFSFWWINNHITQTSPKTPEKTLVIIIPSFNNSNYYKKNLDSIFMQKYDNYRVVYIDDCSTDNTAQLVQNYINIHNLSSKITLQKNQTRQGALSNLYHAIHACKDDEIIVTVDGDDWLAHEHVFSRINSEYANPNVWLTFGQFIFWPEGKIGYCQDIPQDAIITNQIRQHCGLATHLRTFYAGLFKKINKEDLMYQGAFYAVTWDKAMMAPMLEMAHGKWKFIPDVLYVYNYINPLSDARLHGDMQNVCAAEIKSKLRYQELSTL